ncbi:MULTISPECIES: lipopolysaccharide assembly protein LapA domain-containing protein [Deinococcus]|uniref:lipopolysaccharide assembly protein LapA domain-containing protein n=1 Tax=Deinococcus TaxID=1298 RepID=UPI0010547AF7|nr:MULTISPECIES: lipopolysaccharide assembly protein LapA domain-containing protein [Deinococcus]TDE86085.1 DUF1049 domain-containing protein [Deinococcus sp. S9]
MRLVQFVQVLLLLVLGAYLLLVALENPAPVRLPLPLGRGEWSLPVGWAVTLFMGLGAAYAALLLLPPLWQAGQRRRRAARERAALERRLAATLQARLGSLSEPAPAAERA